MNFGFSSIPVYLPSKMLREHLLWSEFRKTSIIIIRVGRHPSLVVGAGGADHLTALHELRPICTKDASIGILDTRILDRDGTASVQPNPGYFFWPNMHLKLDYFCQLSNASDVMKSPKFLLHLGFT